MYWKTFGGHPIYQSETGIKVSENFFYRWLTLNSDILQTHINRRHPEKPSLTYINHLLYPAISQPGEMCLLGLGGAGVVHAVEPYLGEANITAVESNLEVIEIAHRFFMTDQLKKLSIVHQDAQLFLQQSQTEFKHLLVDLFDAYAFPPHCNSDGFFALAKRALLPGGILAVNLANLREQWPVFEHIRHNFDECTLSLPVRGTANMVILACKDSSLLPLLSLIKTNKRLKKLSWDSKWGCFAQLY